VILQKSLKILLPRTIWLRLKHESAENELDCRTEKLLRDSETSVKLRWPGLEAFTAPLFDGEKKEKL